MTSVCTSSCVNDARDPRIPVRASYVNLYKWPESDAEFVRSVSFRLRQQQSDQQNHVVDMRNCNYYCRPRVVDSISRRQMYLRSYTFSREDSEEEKKSQKCFGRVVKEKVGVKEQGKRKRCRLRKKKESSPSTSTSTCSVLFRFFHRLLTCSASVDVVDRK